MILVFGRSGQVAKELARLDSTARFLGREDANLEDPAACAKAIRETAPSCVINAAAYTAVDRAEGEEAVATLVNAEAPRAMATTCRQLGIPLVQISTDYVFDGSGNEPFPVDAAPAPLGAYGRSKLKGEEAVRLSGAAHAIIRTSWIFSAHATNFVKTMLQLARSRDCISVVADQIGSPTPASAIAEASLVIARGILENPQKSGTYHFAGTPEVSWADFAREIFRQADKDISVLDIPTSSYPTRARRPANSRLDCSKLGIFGLRPPEWKEGLREVLEELNAR